MNNRYKCRRLRNRLAICCGVALFLCLFGIFVRFITPVVQSLSFSRVRSSASSIGAVSNAFPTVPRKDSSPTESSTVPERLPQKPVSYFDDAVFIGDSRTEGLMLYNGLGKAKYYAIQGLMINTVYTKPAIQTNSGKIPVMKALSYGKFSKVYVMLGVNELGWSDAKQFPLQYAKMVDDIKSSQKGAKIYIQSILPVSQKRSETDPLYSNSKIITYNKELKKIAQEKKVTYLEVNQVMQNTDGFLPQEASTDGVHLSREYLEKWCVYLRNHT